MIFPFVRYMNMHKRNRDEYDYYYEKKRIMTTNICAIYILQHK